MTIGTRAQFERAIKRANELGGVKAATDLGDGRYRVIGRRGDRYTATVDADGEWSCTCPAGANDLPCWHQGAAWLRYITTRPFTPAATPTRTAPRPEVGTAPEWNPPADEWDRTPNAVTVRASGRGIGFTAPLPDEEGWTLAEMMAANGCQSAIDALAEQDVINDRGAAEWDGAPREWTRPVRNLPA